MRLLPLGLCRVVPSGLIVALGAWPALLKLKIGRDAPAQPVEVARMPLTVKATSANSLIQAFVHATADDMTSGLRAQVCVFAVWFQTVSIHA